MVDRRSIVECGDRVVHPGQSEAGHDFLTVLQSFGDRIGERAGAHDGRNGDRGGRVAGRHVDHVTVVFDRVQGVVADNHADGAGLLGVIRFQAEIAGAAADNGDFAGEIGNNGRAGEGVAGRSISPGYRTANILRDGGAPGYGTAIPAVLVFIVSGDAGWLGNLENEVPGIGLRRSGGGGQQDHHDGAEQVGNVSFHNKVLN